MLSFEVRKGKFDNLVRPDDRTRPEVPDRGAQLGRQQFVVSETGTALYGLTGFSQGGDNQLVEVDLNGVETQLPLDFSAVESPRYSPNGRYIAYFLSGELRIYDAETGANDRLSTGGNNRWPVWSADGRYLFFAITISPSENVGYRRLSDLSEEPEPIYRDQGRVFPVSAYPSGEMLISGEVSSDRGQDLLIMSEGQDGMLFTPYLRADWNEYSGAISPNGGCPTGAGSHMYPTSPASPRSMCDRSRTLLTKCRCRLMVAGNRSGHPMEQQSITGLRMATG